MRTSPRHSASRRQAGEPRRPRANAESMRSTTTWMKTTGSCTKLSVIRRLAARTSTFGGQRNTATGTGPFVAGHVVEPVVVGRVVFNLARIIILEICIRAASAIPPRIPGTIQTSPSRVLPLRFRGKPLTSPYAVIRGLVPVYPDHS
jgi:hypothetical protein